MKEIRRNLRNHTTPAEKKLWYHLRRRQILGKKFRRQYSYRGYVMDFFCPELSLGIELDGAHHFTVIGQLNDGIRTELLEKNGIQIIRFENEMVFFHLEEVIETIRDQMLSKMKKLE